METAPLKSFATWARTALIAEVTARIAVVAAPASNERVELPRLVDALEKAVNAAGGGDKGRAAVADRVAYTWFNRIIALRFMDANGYTGIAVVSPQAGVAGGQPEVLAEAKRGNIDADVVGQKTAATVVALLNGTRRSDDPQGEAYALLLADYCRYWNRSMPFMFEREGDFTELLIPANLLADDSVLNRAATVLTKDVCKDVEVIGWLYQFYISERKDEVFAGFKKNKKAGADEIPAATQLFTPHWIVRYLVENSLGRLWMLNRPNSHLVDQMDYYIAPVDEEADFLKISSPEEIKVLDPACGSGHMLTYAFDLLHAIYEEEGYAPSDIPGLILANNLYGTEIDPRAGALAAFALTMKARARQRTYFNKQIEPMVCVLESVHFTADELEQLAASSDFDKESRFFSQFEEADILGALVRPQQQFVSSAEELVRRLPTDDLFRASLAARAARVVTQAGYLASRYHVVVANPPYMGDRNMSQRLGTWAKREWPDSKSNLYAMFIERNLALALSGGFVAMITMESWMFLSSYRRLRETIISTKRVDLMAHLGTNAFESIGGEIVATTAFVLSNRAYATWTGAFVRLVEEPTENKKAAALKSVASNPVGNTICRVTNQELLEVPGSPIAYWVSGDFRKVFTGPTLESVTISDGQNKTGDNARFLRMFWEVSSSRIGRGSRWLFYAKGGGFRRWSGNMSEVVDWSAEARNHYRTDHVCRIIPEYLWYEKGITWGLITSLRPSFRFLPSDATFDVGGSSVFFKDDDDIQYAMGLLNSNLAEAILRISNPTINFQVQNIRDVPYLVLEHRREIEGNVARLLELSQTDWDTFEQSRGFTSSPLLESGKGHLESRYREWTEQNDQTVDEMRRLEEDNNRLFIEAYTLDEELAPDVPLGHVSLTVNPSYRFGEILARAEVDAKFRRETTAELISYAVGCMFGRYSLDEPGLVLADQGATIQDFLAKVPSPTFMPDTDNVIPIVDGDWFEDDIVARFREFLRVAFGEQHFEENLRFVTESLGVKDLRAYFVKSFYKDHVQRYKKRPIYWLFSSPKGSFNALIYMHRYTPSTSSTVLNEYLREFKAKLDANLQHQERLATGGGDAREQAKAQKEADRLRKVIVELDEYEHDVLYPLASQQVAIDLDDGVKANYPKLGSALKKIPGLEASDE